MTLTRSLPALAFVLALTGCAAALPVASPSAVPAVAPAVVSSVVSSVVPTLAPSAAATAVPTPAATPALWLAARFTDVVGIPTDGDASAFDTRRLRDDGQVSGGVSSAWQEAEAGGPRVFVVQAFWAYGSTPWNGTRGLELRFLAPPVAGQRLALAAGAPTATTAQLTYQQGFRFRDDLWTATAGELAVAVGDGGGVRIAITGAAMAPAPRGTAPPPNGPATQSQSAGTFTLAGEGLVWPADMSVPAEPAPLPTAEPLGPDLAGLWTFAISAAPPTPIPACGAPPYRRFTFSDPERDGRDMSVAVEETGEGQARVQGRLAGGLVGDRYVFEGTVTYTAPDGTAKAEREILELRFDAASGQLQGVRQVGASVSEGGRGGLPVALLRPRFEAPPPDGCK